MKTKNSIVKLTVSAVFAAMVFVMTCFLMIPLGSLGYVHLGDAALLLSGAVLPFPFAFFAVFGSVLADIVSGYAIWAPITLVVKLCMLIPFAVLKNKEIKIIGGGTVVAALIAAAVNVAGYYLGESILFGSFVSPLSAVFPNTLQSLSGLVVFSLVGVLADRGHIVHKLMRKLKA